MGNLSICMDGGGQYVIVVGRRGLMDNDMLLWVAKQLGYEAMIIGSAPMQMVGIKEGYRVKAEFSLTADTLRAAYFREKAAEWLGSAHQIGICPSGEEWFLWDEDNQTHIGVAGGVALWPSHKLALIAGCEHIFHKRAKYRRQEHGNS